jgi:hypothetical protein
MKGRLGTSNAVGTASHSGEYKPEKLSKKL